MALSIWNRLEALCWVLGAVLVGFFGNGRSDVVTILSQDPRVNRTALWLALGFSLANVLLFLFFSIYLERIRGIAEPQRVAPWAVPAGSVAMASACILFIISIWPVFGWLSPLMVLLLGFGVLNALALMPHFGLLEVKQKRG